MQAKFGYRLDDPKWAPDWLSNEQLEMLHSDIDARQIIDGEYEQILKDLRVSLVVSLLFLIFILLHLTDRSLMARTYQCL